MGALPLLPRFVVPEMGQPSEEEEGGPHPATMWRAYQDSFITTNMEETEPKRKVADEIQEANAGPFTLKVVPARVQTTL